MVADVDRCSSRLIVAQYNAHCKRYVIPLRGEGTVNTEAKERERSQRREGGREGGREGERGRERERRKKRDK
jgi:hypothetical protein